MKRQTKYDRFGFEVLEYDEPMDYTSTDDDDGDLNTTDAPAWWRDDSYAEEELSNN